MASKELNELRHKLFNENYKMLSKKTEYDGMSENPSLKVSVVLEKDGSQINIHFPCC